MLNQGDVDRDGVLIANYTSNWDYCDSGTNWPEWRGVRTCRYTFVKWLKGDEELYDHQRDPYQMNNLAKDPEHGPLVRKLRDMKDLLKDAHDEFLPGTKYAEWFDDQRNVIRTGLGPINK